MRIPFKLPNCLAELFNCLMCVAQDRHLYIPKIPIRGSYFGSCTCGVDKRDDVPCEHMAVVAAGSRVKDVTRDNIFPYWVSIMGY